MGIVQKLDNIEQLHLTIHASWSPFHSFHSFTKLRWWIIILYESPDLHGSLSLSLMFPHLMSKPFLSQNLPLTHSDP